VCPTTGTGRRSAASRRGGAGSGAAGSAASCSMRSTFWTATCSARTSRTWCRRCGPERAQVGSLPTEQQTRQSSAHPHHVLSHVLGAELPLTCCQEEHRHRCLHPARVAEHVTQPPTAWRTRAHRRARGGARQGSPGACLADACGALHCDALAALAPGGPRAPADPYARHAPCRPSAAAAGKRACEVRAPRGHCRRWVRRRRARHGKRLPAGAWPCAGAASPAAVRARMTGLEPPAAAMLGCAWLGKSFACHSQRACGPQMMHWEEVHPSTSAHAQLRLRGSLLCLSKQGAHAADRNRREQYAQVSHANIALPAYQGAGASVQGAPS